MIRYLQAMKRKKGFTMVELVIVIAIIAIIMAAMFTTMLSGSTEKLLAANTNAEAFFTASQLSFTRMSFTERSLVTVVDEEDKYIEYINGVNTIKANTYLFLEAHCGQTGLDYVHLCDTLPGLMMQVETKPMTNLEQYVMESLQANLSESYDGYFYAQIDEDFRIICTHYSDGRLPMATSESSAYRESIGFTGDGKIANIVVGSCSDTPFFGGGTDASGDPAEYAFNAPGADADGDELTKFYG